MAKKQKPTTAPADRKSGKRKTTVYVRLSNGVTVVLEIKGFEDDQTKAKRTAASRWVEAVNNWGQLRRWAFHVCRSPQLLDKEMEHLARAESVRSGSDSTVREER